MRMAGKIDTAMSSSGETDIGMGSLSTSSPTGTTTDGPLLNVTGNAGPARPPSLATSPTLAWPTSSGRVPAHVAQPDPGLRCPHAGGEDDVTDGAVAEADVRLVDDVAVALIGAAAQVSTQPELVAEAALAQRLEGHGRAPAARATATNRHCAAGHPAARTSRRTPASESFGRSSWRNGCPCDSGAP